MINRIIGHLNISSPQSVAKVGDTIPDMQAARRAKVWGIGITESGSEFGLTRQELADLPLLVRAEKHAAAEHKLRASGAHTVIKSLFELPDVLRGLCVS